MSELLPDPLTPVTTLNVPNGICAVTFCRLLCVAPTIVRNSELGTRGAELFPLLRSNRPRCFLDLSVFRSEFRVPSSEFVRRLVGTAIAFVPLRYGPVTEPLCL